MIFQTAREWIGDRRRVTGWAEESRLGHLADRLFNWSDMSRHDREAWAEAASLRDVGALTMRWLYGGLSQTPVHCAPPCEETIPYLDVLVLANLCGFVTTNSQAGDHDHEVDAAWSADVCGFITDDDLGRMRQAIDGTGLVMETWCRGREHNGHTRLRGCPGRDQAGFYADRCPRAAAELHAAWFITISDPEPDRNDRLWPALARFAVPEVAA
jgi:hypothetical protein